MLRLNGKKEDGVKEKELDGLMMEKLILMRIIYHKIINFFHMIIFLKNLKILIIVFLINCNILINNI